MRRATRALLFLSVLSFPLTVTCGGQNNRASEKCINDGECETGNCIELKDKKEQDKRICLYCSQVNYDKFQSDVQTKCKHLDDIGRYFDLKSELQRAANRSNEFSLLWLVHMRDISADCLTARVTREHSCWNEHVDSEQQQQIDDLKQAVNATQYLIQESIRNGRAYNLDREHFTQLTEAEERSCKDLDKNVAWLKGLKDDEQGDCTELSSVTNEARGCREVRNSIVNLFQDHASSERMESLRAAETAESEAKRILDLKNNNHLCK